MDNRKQNFLFGKILKLKNMKHMLIIIVSIIVLVIFSGFFKTQSKEENIVENNIVWSWQSYCDELENKLKNVLGQIKNVGNINVFVMVDSSPTIKYLEETKKESNDNAQVKFETTIVMSKNGSITTPVVVVEILPKITGILVVASGAKDIKIKNTLINAISAVLNVSVSNVEVLEGK